MLKILGVAPLVAVLVATHAFAEQKLDTRTDEEPLNKRVKIDTMMGCYAHNMFYSEGMPLDTSAGIVYCKRSHNSYGVRDKSMPFEWAKDFQI